MTNARNTSNIPNAGGNRNMIINGGMDVWQRGTSFATIASGVFTVDRFAHSRQGAITGTLTISQSTSVPTPDQAKVLFNFSLLATVGTAQASLGATDLAVMYQGIEGYNWRNIAQRPMVLSFWVRSSLTGIYGVRLNTSNSDRAIVLSYTIDTANTWEYKSIQVPSSPSAGTWNYTNGVGAYISWALACGSTGLTSTIGSWQTGSATTVLAPTGQANLYATSGNSWQMTGAQLESGTVSSRFEFMAYDEILQACQRYTYVLTEPHFVGIGIGTTTLARMGSVHPSPMRGAPTITMTGNLPIYNGTTTGTITSLGTNYSNGSSIEFDATASFSPASGSTVVTYNNGGANKITVAAEL
jgi:hypothetical protein